jgi:hypothetical protein
MPTPLQEITEAESGLVPGEFRKALGLFDSIMIVAGIMVGSGIFIVSAEISRQVGSAGWLIVTWIITGVLTVAGALSYGELAAMMPQGRRYVRLPSGSLFAVTWVPLWMDAPHGHPNRNDRTATTWPGLLIIASGVPVYFYLRWKSKQAPTV